MWNIFRKSLKTGIVTRDITYQTEAHGFQGPPQIDFARCTACKGCVQVCPANALAIIANGKHSTLVLNVARCVFCDRCRIACPEKIIKATTDFHHATGDKANLVIQGHCGKGS
jgi:formate hydrogenlyase subunit 6/NADH:ubiquinone oxidoreductase subunit I